jgi:hypothetical protein
MVNLELAPDWLCTSMLPWSRGAASVEGKSGCAFGKNA